MLRFDQLEEKFIERDETVKRLEDENMSLMESIKLLQQ